MLTSSVAFETTSREIPPPGPLAFDNIYSSASAQHTVQLHDLPPHALQAVNAYLDGDEGAAEWSEEDVVWLHWRLLSDLDRLSDPLTPLEEKLDTLAWVFSEPHLDSRPFSFANCLQVVGTSPMSPTPYFGRLDVDAIRDWIRVQAKRWIHETIALYPKWVQQQVLRNLEWTARQLAKNPQWINEQIKLHSQAPQADLFGLEGGQ